MIVKFLPNKGKGTCLATMNYLLGKKGDREHAKILQGDPKLTQQLADSLEFKHKYTVGVLSFQEKDLDEKTKREIIADFEQSLLCGFEADQYNICWIEHRDKGRLELNFVIPKVELSTGKALNPYFDSVDRPRINAWKDLANAKYDLHDPNDPANRQPYTPNMRLPQDKKELQEAITGYLMGEMAQGKVKDRKDVLNAIENDLGLSIARITPNSISISDPTNEKGRNIRLKGEIYANTFRFSEDHSAENYTESREYRANRIKRISEARAKLEAEIARKREFNQQLYNRPRTENNRQNQHSISSQDDDWELDGDVIDSDGSIILSKFSTSQKNRQTKNRASRDTASNKQQPTTSQDIEQSSDWTRERRLFHRNQEQEHQRLQEQRWQTSNHYSTGLKDHAERLHEQLHQTLRRVRTADTRTEQISGTTERINREIDKRESDVQREIRNFDSTINSTNTQTLNTARTIDEYDREIKQRESTFNNREQQINQIIAEQNKVNNRYTRSKDSGLEM